MGLLWDTCRFELPGDEYVRDYDVIDLMVVDIVPVDPIEGEDNRAWNQPGCKYQV
jgi:hypothetical protein